MVYLSALKVSYVCGMYLWSKRVLQLLEVLGNTCCHSLSFCGKYEVDIPLNAE